MRVLVVGGDGRFGSWFARFCAQKMGDKVAVCDRRNEGELPTLAAVADVAILSVPLPLAPEIGARLAASMPEDGLIVDVSSIKRRVFAALEPTAQDLLLIHPMCAPPEELSLAGAPLIEAHYRFREDGRVPLAWMSRFTAGLGGRVETMSVAAHDRVAKATQVDVHASLLALGEDLVSSGLPFGTLKRLAPPVGAGAYSGLERHFRFGSPDIFVWLQAEFIGAEAAEALRPRWLAVRRALFGIPEDA